jgi:hypothetical protein
MVPLNFIFEKGEVQIDSLYKKGDKNECCNYQGISLGSLVSNLLNNLILFWVRDAVDKGIWEEKCGFRKGRGCFGQILTLRSMIEKCL